MGVLLWAKNPCTPLTVDIWARVELVLDLVLATYRGTSLIRNTPLLKPCSGTMPRALWRS